MCNKKFINCKDCEYALSYLPAGFNSLTAFRCSDRDAKPCDSDDGCTLGREGTPGVYVEDWVIELGYSAAVNGYE